MTNTIEKERADAEQQYTITAFDYVKNPVGSYEWLIYWQAWQASAQLQRERQASDSAWTSNDIDDTNCNSDTLEQFCRDNIRLAPFFAMLAGKLAQPTPNQDAMKEG